MKVRSLYLENVRGLPSMRLDFVDPVSRQIRPRTLIAGTNGTGKTTIIELIGQLLGYVNLQDLGWVEVDSSTIKLLVDGIASESDATLSVEICPDGSKHIGFLDPETEHIDSNQSQTNSGSIKIFGPAADIRKQIKDVADNSGNFPTCIYFPPEDRQLKKKATRGEVIDELTPYQWVYRFNDSQQWRGSLESYLVDLYFTDVQNWYKSAQQTNGKSNPLPNEGEFSKFVKLINSFLYGKKIQDVSEEKRVLVKTDDGLNLSFDQLSSGEKQIILLLGEIRRRIQHGSIVMIDEPEIHLHPRWQRMLMRAVTDLCEAYDAQLIITTQSEEIANTVYEHELVLLDRIFESDDAQSLQDLQLS